MSSQTFCSGDIDNCICILSAWHFKTSISLSLSCILPLYGQVSFIIDANLIGVVHSPYFRLLSSITSLIAFSLVFLFPSSFAVVLLALFLLNSYVAAYVLSTFSVYFSSQLLLTPLYSFCVPPMISSTCDAKSTFQMLQAILFYSDVLSVFLLHIIQHRTNTFTICFLNWRLSDPHMRSIF